MVEEWSSQAMMAPIADAHWPEALGDCAGTFATDLNVYRVMARHPPLLRSWRALREHIVRQSTLGAERAEVVIIRCAVAWQSEYEIAHHVSRARALGMAEERIESLLGALDGLSEEDRLLAQAVTELVRGGRTTGKVVELLIASVGEAGTLDLMATVGMYTTLAFITNSFRTPIDADVVTGTTPVARADTSPC